jgi:hypothetical protein
MKLGQDCYIVRDSNGHALAYVYFEDEPGRRPALAHPRRGAAHCSEHRQAAGAASSEQSGPATVTPFHGSPD